MGTNSKHILYCIPQLYNSGGMERVLCQKINYLAQHTDYELHIATTELTPRGMKVSHFPLDTNIRIHGLDIDFDADFSKPLPVKWLQHQRKMKRYKAALTRLIEEQHIDVCISMCGKEIAFLDELPCKTIAEMHFSKNQRLYLIEAFHHEKIWHWLGKIRVQQLVHNVRRLPYFVVLTAADKREWEAAGCTHVECIPNPCVLDGVALPQKQDTKQVIAVGRLHPQKGFERLIDAWQTVARYYPDWSLHIIGEGAERAALQRQIDSLHLESLVCLDGRCDDMASVYRRTDILAMSSRYEGLPLVLIEAMWCGVPCVAFDCPHGPAELLSDGRGVVVPDGDVQLLAEKIIDLIRHPDKRRTLGMAAQQYAQTHFSEQVIMEQWINLIKTCE